MSLKLPQYKCHKVVGAIKIKDMKPFGGWMPNVVIIPAEEGIENIIVHDKYIEKHKPHIGGYYVLYGNGYESFSPADAFESGYTKI